MTSFSYVLPKSLWIFLIVNVVCFYQGLNAKEITEPESNNRLTSNLNAQDDQDTVDLEDNQDKSYIPDPGISTNNEDNEEDGTVLDVGIMTSNDFVKRLETQISWRNIIDAPPKQCPPGQKLDSRGRCRIIIN